MQAEDIFPGPSSRNEKKIIVLFFGRDTDKKSSQPRKNISAGTCEIRNLKGISLTQLPHGRNASPPI